MSPEDAMPTTVRIAGSGDAFGHGERYQACISVQADGHQLLLDCGATSLLALRRAGIDPNAIDAVLISHFHGDHVGGLPYLVLDGQFSRRSRALLIAGPQGVADRVRALMEGAFPGSSSSQQRFGVIFRELGATPVEVGPWQVTARPVPHTPGAEAVGLRLVGGSRVIAYSGDCEWAPALAELSLQADLFLCEAYTFEKKVPYHLDHATLVAHSKELSAKRVVLTHLGAEMLARIDDAKFPCARDGLTIEL